MTFEEALALWLPAQRWFAGKGTPISALAISANTPLVDGDPALAHLLVGVTQGGTTDVYQLLVGFRDQIPHWLRHAVIGGPAGHGMRLTGGLAALDGMTAYDALHDSELTRPLLAAMAAQRRAGPLRFASEPDAEIDAGLESLVLTAEQTNTSLVFGEDAILKVFRRPTPGPNPDLEVTQALARLGSPHVAAPLGWFEGTLNGADTVLGILSAYLRAAADGWSLAATSVRDLYAAAPSMRAADAGGDFAGEAHRLGEATAEVHRDLAAAFGTEELPSEACTELASQMLDRLASALASVPELAPYAGLLHASFAEVASLDGPLVVQRIHGDYHLGQAMRTQTGWVLLDFEGEPAAPVEQRVAPSPALRDVAAMMRSFEYAARHQLPEHDDADPVRAAARDWVRRNQSAFCAGYAQAGGADPVKHAALLRALIFDKAVYEVVYEARNRPSWLHIPLGSIADAAAGDAWGSAAP